MYLLTKQCVTEITRLDLIHSLLVLLSAIVDIRILLSPGDSKKPIIKATRHDCEEPETIMVVRAYNAEATMRKCQPLKLSGTTAGARRRLNDR